MNQTNFNTARESESRSSIGLGDGKSQARGVFKSSSPMSSYFDNIRRKVSELARECPNTIDGGKQFLFGLMEIEKPMIRTCELFAGDVETPQDVRETIMECIWLNKCDYNGGETFDDIPNATQMAYVTRSSRLESEMHSLWHDIARMRYQMRYGPVSDNPEWAVERRDRFVEENAGKPHPWQNQAPTAGDEPLRLSDYRRPKKFRAPEDQETPSANSGGAK